MKQRAGGHRTLNHQKTQHCQPRRLGQEGREPGGKADDGKAADFHTVLP